jgi:ArsR family transcriptional regulator, nickel/cobalt-responsive transcriptional repressor
MFALSTPSRLQILGCLRAGPRTVSEIVEAVEMEQSSVSHQLRVLRDHSLLSMRRIGRTRQYALRNEHIGALIDEALAHVRSLERPESRQLDPFADAKSAAS